MRANAVALGVIDTPMHAPETHEALAALHPVGRLGEISDVVDAVRYLETAPFVTGEILHADGGQSAGHQKGPRSWHFYSPIRTTPEPPAVSTAPTLCSLPLYPWMTVEVIR